MGLTQIQIENNKAEFLSIIDRLRNTRVNPNDDWEGLISFLTNSDFFIAPASSTFHNNFEGGLCEHSLNVYHTLVNMSNMHYTATNTMPTYTWENLALVALFHDISKVNQYEKQFKNVKEYWDGNDATRTLFNKQDEGGYFRWAAKSSYGKKPLKNSYTYGSHEESSVFILQEYLKLDKIEIQAILPHRGQFSQNFNQSKELTYCFSNNMLACMLHLADSYSAFVLEETCDE